MRSYTGKTTQVPQYIFDEHCIRDEYCNIIVAQPRRIAAINNAKRVCAERDWKLGTLVGYQVIHFEFSAICHSVFHKIKLLFIEHK